MAIERTVLLEKSLDCLVYVVINPCLALKKVDTKVNKEWQMERQKQGMRKSI